MDTVWELLPAMSLFAFVTAMTPGPNNFLLASSGAQFGVRRSVRHLVGIRFGIVFLLLFCAGGVAIALEQHPTLYRALRYLGLGYMLWLVAKLIVLNSMANNQEGGRPLSFLQAMFFQLGNIKAWMACLALVTSYSLPGDYWLSVLAIIVVFTVFGFFANSCWTLLGRWIKTHLDTPGKQRVFNLGIGLLTIVSLAPAFTAGI
ncbi:LysE family translocator [Photobacterium alginatilyticum]|uniref:LysE family translocator n=1 Tax=Photobacterium alginatilyticum TaxID=1775171 RepID=A0ABW9YDT2_9GAMM|nr:LysE family translocator [Photobacterium alginatilyticum]NBI51878.1 LysE family translocator [Photobacterium alginatilyticum]